MKKYISEIDLLFKTLNDSRTQYCVLRGYLNEQDFYESKDFDLYVPKKKKKMFEKIVFKLGYKTPSINDNVYPHKQYFKLVEGRMIKIDVVYGLCFGNKLLCFNKSINIEQDSFILNGKRVLKNELSLLLFILHLFFDKRLIVSPANKKRLLEYLEALKIEADNVAIYSKTILDIISLIKASNQSSLEIYYSKYFKAIKKEYLKRSNVGLYHRVVRFINSYRLQLRNKTRERTITFIGVDGSGKSSSLEYVSNVFNDKVYVQYMGFKDMETKYGELYLSPKKIRPAIKRFLYIHKEMKYRYKKAKASTRRIVLFDRYVWEAVDNSNGKYHLIFWILFKLFFPKPKLTVYLYCDTSLSLSRKDDIVDKNAFIFMKNKFDKTYLYKKKTITIDTGKMSYEETLNIFCNAIMKNKMYELLI